MQIRKIVPVVLLSICVLSSTALAAPRYCGVKVRSGSVLSGMKVDAADPLGSFSSLQRPYADTRVWAVADIESFFGFGRTLSVHVFNHSDRDIPAKRVFSTFTVLGPGGKRFDLDGDAFSVFPQTEFIPRGEDMVFKLPLGHVPLKDPEIAVVVCSFDMGGTKIVLLPVGQNVPEGIFPSFSAVKAPVTPVTEKPPAVAPQAPAVKPAAEVRGKAIGAELTKAAQEQTAPVVSKAAEKKEAAPAPKRKPRQKKEGKPLFRHSAKIKDVRSASGFILLAAGTQEGLRKDMVLTLQRDGRMIGKAFVRRCKEHVSTARSIRSMTFEQVKPGDDACWF